MRLAPFINQNVEIIIARWEVFAATCLPAAARMDSLELRNHSRQILLAVAKDIETPQTSKAQSEKSMGRAPVVIGAPETAAETHAILRAKSGFDINQLAAEYRALRASVLELWANECDADGIHVGDLIRFNEAIDQALAESISFFSKKIEASRNLLLGMLGHDMRNPLQTIQVTSSYLAALNAGEKISEAANRLMRSGARMRALLDDLIDFNRSNLGLGIRVKLTKSDLTDAIRDEIDQLRTANPGRLIELTLRGDLKGMWDASRLQQVLGNLVTNALKHGKKETPVHVTISGDGDNVRFEVRNEGPTIDDKTLSWIFEPLKRAAPEKSSELSDGLGLGLYIAREIAKSHGGEIQATSDQTHTVFSVILPREFCRGDDANFVH